MLVRLSDSGQTVADPAKDVRGRPVLDESGTKLGMVAEPSDALTGYDHLAYTACWLPGYLPPIHRTWRRPG